jgi:hypothetical protein
MMHDARDAALYIPHTTIASDKRTNAGTWLLQPLELVDDHQGTEIGRNRIEATHRHDSNTILFCSIVVLFDHRTNPRTAQESIGLAFELASA